MVLALHFKDTHQHWTCILFEDVLYDIGIVYEFSDERFFKQRNCILNITFNCLFMAYLMPTVC